MHCPACRHENRPGAKFCEECAAPLPRACASCGSELRPTAKFCDECGAPVAGSAPSRAQGGEAAAQRAAGERSSSGSARKVVTIIFADLVGSTGLHERLDAESVRQFMESYYAAMRFAVEAHGGRVTQLLGDGVKAVFGAPRVAEDDAIRAVRAAVEMQRAFHELADQQRERVGKTGLRVAVNTGEVVTDDDTRSASRFPAALGDSLANRWGDTSEECLPTVGQAGSSARNSRIGSTSTSPTRARRSVRQTRILRARRLVRSASD